MWGPVRASPAPARAPLMSTVFRPKNPNNVNLSRDDARNSMGRLHVGLGVFTYVLGFLAAAAGFNVYQGQWVQAVRSGNRGAQSGAMITMIASGGLALMNAYGFGNTLQAGFRVLMATKGEAVRRHGWLRELVLVAFFFAPVGLVVYLRCWS